MTVNVEVGIPDQTLSVRTDMTFTIEENYFVDKIHDQVQRHLTNTMNDSFFEGLLGLGLGTLNAQGFSKVWEGFKKNPSF